MAVRADARRAGQAGRACPLADCVTCSPRLEVCAPLAPGALPPRHRLDGGHNVIVEGEDGDRFWMEIVRISGDVAAPSWSRRYGPACCC